MASALPIRVLAWEITRRCPMACVHCRGAAKDEAYADELTTQEAFRVIDSLHEADCHPLIIFTGGEPMCRDDLEELVRYATARKFPCVLAPCGRFVTEERLSALKTAGERALSISVDGVDAQAHDAFRGVPGAFDIALRAMEVARQVRLPFQINHCVTRQTAGTLRQMYAFAEEQGATRLDCFFLVPVGRGEGLRAQCLSQSETEDALQTILDLDATGSIPLHVTCEPRILALVEKRGVHTRSRFNGCMAGAGFCFLSHVGVLKPCGFFPKSGENVRSHGCNLPEAYTASALFAKLHGGSACLARALASE